MIRNILFVIISLLLVYAAATRGELVDRDYKVYKMYWNLKFLDNVEYSFILIRNLLKNYFALGLVSLFAFYAFFGVVTKLISMRLIIGNTFFLGCLVYLSSYYMLHELTQIRVGVATGFFLISIKYVYEKKLPWFLFFICLGGFFHYSVFMALPVYFLSSKPNRMIYFLLLIPIGYLFYYTGTNLIMKLPIKYFQDRVEVYEEMRDSKFTDSNKINVFNLLFLMKIMIYYFIFFNAKKISIHNGYVFLLIRIYAIALFIFPALAALPAFAFRVNEVFGVVEILLFPLIVYVFRVRFVGYLVVITIAFTLLLLNLSYNKLIL